jgi:hypothetical protein
MRWWQMPYKTGARGRTPHQRNYASCFFIAPIQLNDVISQEPHPRSLSGDHMLYIRMLALCMVYLYTA